MICDLSLKNTLLFNFVIMEKNKNNGGRREWRNDSINV